MTSELKSAKEIGREFGRDHTTILRVARKLKVVTYMRPDPKKGNKVFVFPPESVEIIREHIFGVKK